MDHIVEKMTTRIRPSEVEWEMFQDPHNRPTCPVRMLKTDPPALLDVNFPPNYYAGIHWHPFDTLYFVVEGEMLIGPEGSFLPGDVRWVKAGHPYGPEEAGPKGTRFFLVSMGDEVGLNWADLYEVPDPLTKRLAEFPDNSGRINMNDVESSELADGCQLQILCDTNPYIRRVRITPGATLPAYCHDVDALYMLRGGSMEAKGEREFDAEDVRFLKAGQTSNALSAGSDGADLIIIGVGGGATFEWINK